MTTRNAERMESDMNLVEVTPVIGDKDGWPVLGKKLYMNTDHIISLKETNKLLGGVEGVAEEVLNELSKTSIIGDYIFEMTLVNGKTIEIAENIEHFKSLYGINIMRR